MLDTYLTINATRYTAVSDDLIPTGELLSVDGGPLDFRSPKKLGEDMFSSDHLVNLCGGFDHNFCLGGTGFRKVAEAYEPDSGRVMEAFTDMPGMQLYTFNRPDEGLIGRDGKQMGPHTALRPSSIRTRSITRISPGDICARRRSLSAKPPISSL